MNRYISLILYLLLAPFIGAFLDGIDRKITARMQGRKGPSIWQPFYDLYKLFSKQMIAVNSVQLLLNCSYLIFLAIAGGMVFFGTDILMSLFILSTADMFLILAASSDSSPFSNIGASREMMQMMSYEPMTLLIAVGFYLATGSFRVDEIIAQNIGFPQYQHVVCTEYIFAFRFRPPHFSQIGEEHIFTRFGFFNFSSTFSQSKKSEISIWTHAIL